MGHKRGTGQKAVRRAAELANLEKQLVICPECDCYCRKNPSPAFKGGLFDLFHDQADDVAELVGVAEYLAHGQGVTHGMLHLCPPTRNPMFDVDGPVRLEPVEVDPCGSA